MIPLGFKKRNFVKTFDGDAHLTKAVKENALKGFVLIVRIRQFSCSIFSDPFVQI